MIIYVEDTKRTSKTTELGPSFIELHLALSSLADAFMRWARKREGIDFDEAKESSETQAIKAIKEIQSAVETIAGINKKYRFNKKDLYQKYQDDLAVCQSAVDGVKTELNAIWKYGRPSKKDVLFGNTTSYKFIIGQLVICMDRVNKVIADVNTKINNFNRANKDISPLPFIAVLTSPPSWARYI